MTIVADLGERQRDSKRALVREVLGVEVDTVWRGTGWPSGLFFARLPGGRCVWVDVDIPEIREADEMHWWSE